MPADRHERRSAIGRSAPKSRNHSLWAGQRDEGTRRAHDHQRRTLPDVQFRWPGPRKNSIEIVATTDDSPLAGAVDIKAAWGEYAKMSSSRPPEVKNPKKYNRNSQLNVVVAAKGDHTFDFGLVSP